MAGVTFSRPGVCVVSIFACAPRGCVAFTAARTPELGVVDGREPPCQRRPRSPVIGQSRESSSLLLLSCLLSLIHHPRFHPLVLSSAHEDGESRTLRKHLWALSVCLVPLTDGLQEAQGGDTHLWATETHGVDQAGLQPSELPLASASW